jgi:hypothetical protein
VYAITHASGAHMNPAVTIAVYACGGMRGRRSFGLPASVCTLLYLVVQFVGALAAATLAAHLMRHWQQATHTLRLPRAPAGVDLTQQLWLSAVLAFAYVLVVLNVSCRRPRQVRSVSTAPSPLQLGWVRTRIRFAHAAMSETRCVTTCVSHTRNLASRHRDCRYVCEMHYSAHCSTRSMTYSTASETCQSGWTEHTTPVVLWHGACRWSIHPSCRDSLWGCCSSRW